VIEGQFGNPTLCLSRFDTMRLRPLLLLAFLLVPAIARSAEPTLVVRWNNVLLECVRRSKIGPPMVARAIGEVHTCGYDAWAMYDDVALATRTGAEFRRPTAERTDENRQKAYSYAEYRALLDLFPGQADYVRAQMSALGFDPDDASQDPAAAAGVGNVCARAVTDFRHGDGSNQLGDLHPGAYSDYTGYAPVNTVDSIVDPNRWQPLAFADGAGGFVTPGFVAPQWGGVVSFALTDVAALRPGPPARWPHGSYVAQAEEVLRMNAHLDDREKMMAEYWADGPRSELPPGHWMLFANFVSARDAHTFDQDVVLFFAVGNAVMDAGIATWEAKRFYDSERPITAIRFLKAGKKVLATVPGQGRKVIDGADWVPYQAASFVTPPFPEYPSGHSAFSAAAAEVLLRSTGSDAFGGSVTFAPGVSKVEPGVTPASPVTLTWPTFSIAADEAGISRRYGGIHFEQGDLESRKLGRKVGALVWEKAMEYVHGGPAQRLASSLRMEGVATSAVSGLALVGAHPMRGAGRFSFALPRAGHVRLRIVDVRGRALATLVDGDAAAGAHEATWAGAPAPGVYFALLEAPGVKESRRFVAVE
jgi:hypothetical protein